MLNALTQPKKKKRRAGPKAPATTHQQPAHTGDGHVGDGPGDDQTKFQMVFRKKKMLKPF